MVTNAKKLSTLPQKLQRTKLNLGNLKLDDELELSRVKTKDLKTGNYFSGSKQSEVMMKNPTCTSELMTEEVTETEKELLPMLAYEKIVEKRLI